MTAPLPYLPMNKNLALMACLGTWILSACTHNDGDIGDLYGRWQLTEMRVADSIATPNDLFFSFQSSVIFVSVCNYDLHEAIDYAGNFIHSGDSLCIGMVPRDSVGEGLRSFMSTRWGMADYDDVRLRIEALDRQQLLLSRSEDYWQFQRF